MTLAMRDRTAIAGIGQSEYGRFLPGSQLKLGATALKAALDDAGLEREDIDGIAIHLGWPLGVDYDRVAETYGLDLSWVSQTWLHGRFVTSAIQQAAMRLPAAWRTSSRALRRSASRASGRSSAARATRKARARKAAPTANRRPTV